MVQCGWFWCELQGVIKNKIEQCMGVSLLENRLRFEALYRCSLGVEITAVSWSRSECHEKLYVCFLLTIDVLCHVSFIVIKKNI